MYAYFWSECMMGNRLERTLQYDLRGCGSTIRFDFILITVDSIRYFICWGKTDDCVCQCAVFGGNPACDRHLSKHLYVLSERKTGKAFDILCDTPFDSTEAKCKSRRHFGWAECWFCCYCISWAWVLYQSLSKVDCS